MPLGKALLIFHQSNIDDPRLGAELALTENLSYNGHGVWNDQNKNCLPPISDAHHQCQQQLHDSMAEPIPSSHNLNSDAKLQCAMSVRKNHDRPKAMSQIYPGKAPPRKALPSREPFFNQLKYRHIMSEIKKDSYRQWVRDQSTNRISGLSFVRY